MSSVKQSMFVREMREARMRALGWTDQKEKTMTHTTTEEDRFHIHCRSAVLTTAAETARNRLKVAAEKGGYPYMVPGTWLMTVKIAGNGDYFAEVEAVFAKIVLADQPAEPDAEPEEGNAADENTEPAPAVDSWTPGDPWDLTS